MVIKIVAHKFCVIYRYAETEAFHVINVCDISQQRGHNMVGASGGNGAAEGVDMLQLALLVATGRPFEFIQIHGIGNAKILKRAE